MCSMRADSKIGILACFEGPKRRSNYKPTKANIHTINTTNFQKDMIKKKY